MAIMTPSAFFQNRTDHKAVTHRLATAALLRNASAPTYMGGNGGVAFAPSNLKVLAQASPNMSVRITQGLGILRGREAVSQGNYVAANDAEISPVAIGASHATLERIDAIYIYANDAVYSGALNKIDYGVAVGVNAAVGTAVVNSGALPTNVEVIGWVLVSPGVTSIVQGKITDVRFLYTAQGGVHVARSFESSTAGIDYGDLRYWNGMVQGWNAEATTGWRPIAAAPVDNVQYGGTFTYGTYSVNGTMATVNIADPGYPYYLEGEASLNMTVDSASRWDCVCRLDSSGGTYLGHGICTVGTSSRVKTQWWRSPSVLTGAHSVLFRMEKGFGTNGQANSEGIIYARVIPQPPAANAGVLINV